MKKVLLIGGGAIGLLVCVCLAVAVASNSGTKKTEDIKVASSPVVQAQAVMTAALGATEKATPTPKPPAATATPLPGIGSVIEKGNWRYQVTTTDRQKTIIWSEFGNKTESKGIWQIVHVKIENISKQTQTINTWDFEVKDGKGITYKSASESVSYSSYKKLGKPMDDYPPGVPAEIGIVFDVNPEATGLQLNLVQAKVLVNLGQ